LFNPKVGLVSLLIPFALFDLHILFVSISIFLNADGVSSAIGSDDVQALALANAMRERGVEIYAVSQGPNTNPAYMQQIGTHTRACP
jgi:hypothetical protein